jgi:hypothetical protein
MSARTFTAVSLPKSANMGRAMIAGKDDVVETHHVSPLGDLIISAQNPKSGTVDIKGNLGFVEVDLTIGVAIANNAVTVTITVREPVKLGPAEWVFDVTGNTLTRRQAPSTATLMAASFDWSCILKCGGDQILPIITGCLASLVGGPQAFVTCVVAQLGANSSNIVKCIVASCL